MTPEEMAEEIRSMQSLTSSCRERTSSFIARTQTLQEKQDEWNQKIENCLQEIKKKLDEMERKMIKAAAWASGVGVVVALGGKNLLDYLKML